MPRLSPTMMEFSDFEGLNLIVLPPEKRVFTWTSNTDLPPMSKIDKVLVLFRLGRAFLKCDLTGFTTPNLRLLSKFVGGRGNGERRKPFPV